MFFNRPLFAAICFDCHRIIIINSDCHPICDRANISKIRMSTLVRQRSFTNICSGSIAVICDSLLFDKPDGRTSFQSKPITSNHFGGIIEGTSMKLGQLLFG